MALALAGCPPDLPKWDGCECDDECAVSVYVDPEYGTVGKYPDREYHAKGSTVLIGYTPVTGCRFVQWLREQPGGVYEATEITSQGAYIHVAEGMSFVPAVQPYGILDVSALYDYEHDRYPDISISAEGCEITYSGDEPLYWGDPGFTGWLYVARVKGPVGSGVTLSRTYSDTVGGLTEWCWSRSSDGTEESASRGSTMTALLPAYDYFAEPLRPAMPTYVGISRLRRRSSARKRISGCWARNGANVSIHSRTWYPKT